MGLPLDLPATQIAQTVNLVSAAVTAADYAKAYELADAAIGQGAVHPTLFSARALWLERQSRDEEALADFERAVSVGPSNPYLLNAIGLCLTRLRRMDEAVGAFDEAIRLNPIFSPSYHRKGVALSLAGDFRGAQRAHEQAVRLNPHDSEALANLASIAARNGETGKAQDFATRALKLDPRQPTAIATQALLANSEGRYAAAEQLVRPLLERADLPPHARAAAFGLLADSLDGRGRADEAFEAYRRDNEELRRLHASRFGGARSITVFARDLVDYFRGTDLGPWRVRRSDTGESARHVFVLGFYRSGTTLLGQVLASHPNVVTLEERDFLLEPAANYLSDSSGLARLATLDESGLEAERDAYWRRITDSGVRAEGKVLVDKQPLNTIKLPLIARLFPDAKIVFAMRDPRDVVLSCFRRHFEMNAGMFDLLTIEGAAAFYDTVMQLAETVQPVFGQPFFLHRYEDMVEDFDARIGALCDQLGLIASPAMREFHAYAKAADIRSPSAMQVTRELYREGVEQWRRYSGHLRPVMPVLAPWIAKYGYPQE